MLTNVLLGASVKLMFKKKTESLCNNFSQTQKKEKWNKTFPQPQHFLFFWMSSDINTSVPHSYRYKRSDCELKDLCSKVKLSNFPSRTPPCSPKWNPCAAWVPSAPKPKRRSILRFHFIETIPNRRSADVSSARNHLCRAPSHFELWLWGRGVPLWGSHRWPPPLAFSLMCLTSESPTLNMGCVYVNSQRLVSLSTRGNYRGFSFIDW